MKGREKTGIKMQQRGTRAGNQSGDEQICNITHSLLEEEGQLKSFKIFFSQRLQQKLWLCQSISHLCFSNDKKEDRDSNLSLKKLCTMSARCDLMGLVP